MPPEPPLPSAFEAIEAPWTLKGEAWWFALSLVGGAGRAQPPGSFDPLERYSAELGEDAQSFSGGLGVAMLIRYHDSPVGPYEELLLVPGQFDLPQSLRKAAWGKTTYRVTRIYVSSTASVANGRRNWNIPKHLAKFDFRTLSDGQTEVRVYPISPSSSEVSPNPCFAARLTESRFFPSLPLNTSRLPMGFDLVQPPLEASPSSDKDGVVGTKKWKLVPGVSFKGRITLGGVQGLLDGDGPKGGARIGDGSGFPDIKPYSVAMHWTSVEVGFPAPQILP